MGCDVVYPLRRDFRIGGVGPPEFCALTSVRSKESHQRQRKVIRAGKGKSPKEAKDAKEARDGGNKQSRNRLAVVRDMS